MLTEVPETPAMKEITLITMAACAALLPSSLRAGGCEALTEALVKGLTTPWHATMVSTIGGISRTVEIITLADRSYSKTQFDGWKKRSRSDAATEARVRKDWAKSACTAGGSETVGGEVANIVLHHTSGLPGESSDTRFWISQATGLVLKSETTAGRAMVTTTYDYRDVTAPTE
jgi:hypothetical protein